MHYENAILLRGMRKLQYYDFIRYALGFKYYLLGDGSEVKSVMEDESEHEKLQRKTSREKLNVRHLAYRYYEGKRVETFYIEPNDYELKAFHSSNAGILYCEECFDDIDSGWMWVIMMGVLGIKNYASKETYLHDKKSGLDLFEENYPSGRGAEYRFILGAGVNGAFGIGDWNNLIDSIRDGIRASKSIPTNPDPQKDTLICFEKSMCNTNYIAPQILKDLDSARYYDAIYESLYKKFNERDTYKSFNTSIEETSLYQVARIIATNEGSSALTFNYDDVLERVLINSFSKPVLPVYYNYSSKKTRASIEIIHSHGFYPYGTKGEAYAHSIVLSSYEYMDGYLKPSTYARKKLNAYLMKPCILVGNSLADYEEQKVFFLHHKRHQTNFSYLFTKRSSISDSWMDDYKTIYYMKMGIIPVFFDDFDKMTNYLKDI